MYACVHGAVHSQAYDSKRLLLEARPQSCINISLANRRGAAPRGSCNATFMDGFCPGACAEEAARVALRKSAFDGDYEKQWEHGMALMDAHDSEGYYWICRRAPASRGRGARRVESRRAATRRGVAGA